MKWVKDENFNNLQVQWKIQFLGGGGHEKPTGGRIVWKGGAGGLGQFADLRGGGLAKKTGWCFWEGQVDTPMHIMISTLTARKY